MKPDLHPTAVVGISRFDFEQSYTMDEVFDSLSASIFVNRAMPNFLTSREERVLRLRYFDELTLAEVGADLDVGPERVRQIEAKALRKLKRKTVGLVKQRPRNPAFLRYEKYWEPEHEVTEDAGYDLEPASSPTEIMSCSTIEVRLADGKWWPVMPRQLIVGEHPCEEWQTEAVVVFLLGGKPVGECWRAVRKRVPRTVRVTVPGRWRSRAVHEI